MNKIGILGFGNMGEAILKGIIKKHPDSEITVFDKSEVKLKRSVSVYRAAAAESIKELFSVSDTVILAIKPQDTDAFLKEISGYSKSKNIISVITGKATGLFADSLKTANICRFVPNIAAQCGKAMTALSFHDTADEGFIPEAVEIAESFGKAVIIPEKLMPAFTAISGSGIAFVFQFIHAMAMGGVRAGFTYTESINIALSAAEGAVETIKSSGINPADLVTAVASPSGTTIEGLRILEGSGFNAAVMDAVYASYRRAAEIEESY
ncbi:MAG: pyrroline-5-carboxylate reductase [Spirochaetia bacterium]|jgi:pyrroline-5-carboxylate reductase|nr:pyrroline-5-carboxylate reductase [Spirochaetia bacterium]